MTQFRGLSYPLAIIDGNLAVAEDIISVEDQIVSVLETRPFERVMRSDYGLESEVFKTLEPNAINSRISLAVTSQVPLIDNLEVRGGLENADGGVYTVELRYSVSGTPQPPLTLSLNL